MSDEQIIQIQKLNSALEVQTRTIKNLERQLESARQIIAMHEQEKKAWNGQSDLQNKVMQQQLEMNDNKVRELQQEIIELRKKLKAA